MIIIDEKGEIYSNKQYIALANKNVKKYDDSSFDQSDDENLSESYYYDWESHLILTPER